MQAGGKLGGTANPRRTRRVSLAGWSPQFNAPSHARSIPPDLVLSLVLVKAVGALALALARHSVLLLGLSHASVQLAAPALVTAGALWLVWDAPPAFLSAPAPHRHSRQHSSLGKKPASIGPYAALTLVEHVAFYVALARLSLVRVVVLTAFDTLWARGLPIRTNATKRTVGRNNALVISATIVAASALFDRLFAATSSTFGHACIMLHLVACGQRIDSASALDPEARPRQHALATLAAGAAATALAAIAALFAPSADALASSFTWPGPTMPVVLATGAFVGLTVSFLDPLLSRTLFSHFSAIKVISIGWPVASVSALFVAFVGFSHPMSLPDIAASLLAWTAVTHLVASDVRFAVSSSSMSTAAKSTPFVERFATFFRHLRSTIKTILDTPESRQIYFFLCLNLAFMFVQMLYGIWTNSLGLISDSIHMFFDCAALAMGLFASVMATWPSNDRFTYGYSRVETLSGFANGLFLCLISIFIVFEAIQRLIQPPEMNTSQLLIVSTLGLIVNLVGMFATGHHHHGHSHDHGHDHSGHEHSHNMKGVFLHVLADTLGSVGVIISTLLINRFGWTGFDPIASIFIAVLIFMSVVPLITDAGRLLVLDLDDDKERQVREAVTSLNQLEGIANVSRPRFWLKDPSSMIGSVHVRLVTTTTQDPSRPSIAAVDPDKALARVQQALHSRIANLTELIVEIT